jgi:alkanesulfonate monooxygenase SsuD/methylene tetrahydromethanopterin reductase-like flavin-dependent oxidoreductase (luciferase family)
VPAIVDTEGPGGETHVFDSTAILLYLGEKTGKLMGWAADRGELLSWLFFIATGLGPFLCGGRFRLGVGVGWNEVEFVGLNENFHNRGRRSEEQVQVMQALWAEPHVTFYGKYHTIEDAGINPLPPRRKIPIWFGGHAEVTMRRVVKWGDGWMPMAYAPGDEAKAAFDKLCTMAEAAGRDPAGIGIDTRTTAGLGEEAEWRDTIRFWKSCGATHITLVTYSGRGHLRRIEGRTFGDHLSAIKRYWDTVADLL